MFVYIVKFTDCEFLKIGWAVDCLQRIQKHDVSFDYYYSIKLKNENQARLFESLLHDAFQEKRIPSPLINVINDGRTEFFTECVIHDIKSICNLLNLNLEKNMQSSYNKRMKHKEFMRKNAEKIDYFVDGCIYVARQCHSLTNIDVDKLRKIIYKSMQNQSGFYIPSILDKKTKIP